MINRLSNLLLEILLSVFPSKSSEQKIDGGTGSLVSWLIKFGASAAVLAYIFTRLANHEGALSVLIKKLASLDMLKLSLLLSAGSVCMILNWGIEMFKWNKLISPRLGTYWPTSVKGVLTGTTFGVFTPNRTGEFIGRTLALGASQRITAVILSIVNGVAQTMATLTFGVVGFIYLLEVLSIDSIGFLAVRVLQMLLISLWITSLFLYFRLEYALRFFRRVSWLKRIRKHLKHAAGLNAVELNNLYLLSILRFATFMAQYFIVFSLLIDSPNWYDIAGLSMVTLFSSTILSFVPIPDVLIKEAVALSYFALFGYDLSLVATAVLAVWLINIALPAMIGAFILFTYRIFKPA